MSRILRTRRAAVDLQQIWVYVAERNYSAAERLMERLEQCFEMLASHPHVGECVDELRQDARRFTVGSYSVYFEPLTDGIRLLRIAHSSRRMEDLLL